MRRIALQSPMNEYTGVYCHLVTLQPPNRSKPVTMLYTGSAQQGVLDGSKGEGQVGVCMRLGGYSVTEGESRVVAMVDSRTD